MGKERKVNVSKPKRAANRRNQKIFTSESEEENTVANKKTAKKNIVNPKESSTSKDSALTDKTETENTTSSSTKDVTTRQTILKLDSVEELLRKRREVKQKMEAKKTSTVSKTRAKG